MDEQRVLHMLDFLYVLLLYLGRACAQCLFLKMYYVALECFSSFLLFSRLFKNKKIRNNYLGTFP